MAKPKRQAGRSMRQTEGFDAFIPYDLPPDPPVEMDSEMQKLLSNEATQTARRIVDMRETHRHLIIEDLGKGAANALKLLESMYQRPIFRAADVSNTLGLTQQAAYNLTNRLEAMGLIREMTGHKRNRIFGYDPYIQLFAD
jgi:hypothetical protein